MGPLSIKIKISDRIYPMKVQPEDETFVRKASKMLEERVRVYQKNLGIQDQQDLLAMVAFDCLVEGLKMKGKATVETNTLIHKIENWKEHVEKALQHMGNQPNV
ncbi:cell division protein ZapA [Cardinium endosymbiont of Tipula unca]|uniref:cell division protein ZapA n=1 Tax=Cardinium endosymbiont of Tipula unca TaxID=3066216 RepID=UPI0030CCE319